MPALNIHDCNPLKARRNGCHKNATSTNPFLGLPQLTNKILAKSQRGTEDGFLFVTDGFGNWPPAHGSKKKRIFLHSSSYNFILLPGHFKSGLMVIMSSGNNSQMFGNKYFFNFTYCTFLQ